MIVLFDDAGLSAPVVKYFGKRARGIDQRVLIEAAEPEQEPVGSHRSYKTSGQRRAGEATRRHSPDDRAIVGVAGQNRRHMEARVGVQHCEPVPAIFREPFEQRLAPPLVNAPHAAQMTREVALVQKFRERELIQCW
jgi:hypothetical protein